MKVILVLIIVLFASCSSIEPYSNTIHYNDYFRYYDYYYYHRPSYYYYYNGPYYYKYYRPYYTPEYRINQPTRRRN